MITEIYVSIDGLEYTKLDLINDEKIAMKYTSKDLQDISKVFSPYSLSFTFDATPKNRFAFGFYGDTDVIKVNPDNKFKCKIYTDGVLNLTGFLQLSDLKYSYNKPAFFTASFGTFMTNLKDRIGDDLINDLATHVIQYDKAWTPYYLQNERNLPVVDSNTNIRYFTPFMSNRRVWNYMANNALLYKDNINYFPTTKIGSDKYIRRSEIRPAMSFSTIIDLIIERYGLEIICPLFDRAEFTELFVLCNNENLKNALYVIATQYAYNKLEVRNVSGNIFSIPNVRKYDAVANLITNQIRITRKTGLSNWYDNLNLNFNFYKVVQSEFTGAMSLTIQIIAAADNSIVKQQVFSLEEGTNELTIGIEDDLFSLVNNTWEFVYYVKFSFDNVESYNQKVFEVVSNYTSPEASAESVQRTTAITPSTKYENIETSIDLFKALPEMKVIDFVQSFLKTFNISILDTSPDNDKLYWLTPEDINSEGNEYSSAVLDYTPYVDVKDFVKKSLTDYNYYSFKHKDSKYRSNQDYLNQTGSAFGSISYPLVRPAEAKIFEVKTDFSIIPMVSVPNTPTLLTTYGFSSEFPEVLDNGNQVYKAITDELTIFYKRNAIDLRYQIAVESTTGLGVPVIGWISKVYPMYPFNSEDKSLAFSVIVQNSVSYNDSLYQRYYSGQIERLLNPNTLEQTYTLVLPTNEMYLNSNTGSTPTGFRLQNKIIIGENIFDIVDSTIDITTGQTILTLLNY